MLPGFPYAQGSTEKFTHGMTRDDIMHVRATNASKERMLPGFPYAQGSTEKFTHGMTRDDIMHVRATKLCLLL